MATSTETKELAVAPVRERLLALIAERRPEDAAALRAFATEYLRRLSADAAQTTAPEALLAEVAGAFDFAAARGDRPIAVRAFNPTTAEHGYERPGSVLETNTDDLPFLVDSVRAELEAQGIGIVRVLHPILGLERVADGRITGVLHPREATTRESVMHFDLDRRLDADELAALADRAQSILGDVRRTVLDFPAMAERGRRMVQLAGAGLARYADDEVDETVAFLEWLLADHFILLGYREYRIADETYGVVPGSGLGILADEASSAYARPRPLADLPDGVRERALEGDLLIVTKTNRLSPVHRRARMDYVGVRKIAPDGSVAGEARMIGLFTSKAYVEPASQTPLLNRKLRQILRHEDLIEGSHDYKAAVALFDSFPKDELFSARADDLRRAVVELLSLEGDRVRLLGRRSADNRSVSLIAALPASRYDPDVLEAFLRRAARALRDRRRRRPDRAGGGRAGPRPRDGPRARRRARHPPARPRAGAGLAHPHVGRRPARAAPRPLRPDAAAPSSRRAGDRASRATTAPRWSPRWRSPTSSASSGWSASASRSSSGCRTRRAGRASRSTRRAGRSSSATRCRRSRTSGCA